jgi:flagellar protein FlgJ
MTNHLPSMTASTTDPTAAYNRIQHGPQGKADACDGLEQRRAIKEACSEFESIFIYHLLKEMRASIPDGYLGKSMQSETYTSLFDIEIARRLSEQKGIGLADFLMRQLADRYNKNTAEEITRF